MTILEQIQNQLRELPPEKQSEVLDFVSFLRQRLATTTPSATQRSLRQHPTFGSWCGRKIDALNYQQNLRMEWDKRA